MTTSSSPSSSSSPRASLAPPVPPASRTTGATGSSPYSVMTPLADYTTLRLGGPADRLVEARTEDELVAAARAGALVLAGGSNVVIADEGVRGTVALVRTAGVERDGERLVGAAGEPWDPLVARCVAEGLQGFECLSGIPGSTG